MRKSWVAIAAIALLAALTTIHRVGRSANPPREFVRADRTQESHPIASRRTAPSLPKPPPPPPAHPSDEGASPSTTPTDDPQPVEMQPPASLPPRGTEAPGPVPTPTARIDRPESERAPAADEAVAPPRAVSPPAATAAPSSYPATVVDDTPAAPPIDPNSDRQPPVLDEVRFDPPEIKDGGVAVLSITARDDLSGVKRVSGTVRSPSEAASMPFVAQDPADSGVFVVSIAIPRKAETGDWFVDTLQIVDGAGNPLSLAFTAASVPQGGLLRVVSPDSDATAPTVHRITVEKATVDPGESNRIVVEVDDDRSGVASVTGAFQNPKKAAFIAFTCRPNGETSSWEADVPVPANADCGEWTLRHLSAADGADNTALLGPDDPQVGGARFFVSGGGACDSAPPIIDAMSFSPPAVSNRAAVEITLTARAHDDGSGLASFFGRIEGPVSTSGEVPRIFFAFSPDPNQPNAPMTATITVPQYAARGIWSVAWAQVTDKANNSHAYYRNDPALAGANFTVN
jgi:hypothetical protein